MHATLLLTLCLGNPAILTPQPIPSMSQSAPTPFLPGELPPSSPVGPTIAPAPVMPVIIPSRVPTISEFAASFQPFPGTHTVTVKHPLSGHCVTVTFTLPPGCPKVRKGLRFVTYDYGRTQVTLMFRLCNRVDVQYR